MEIAAGIQLVSAQSRENIYSENSQTKVWFAIPLNTFKFAWNF